MGMGFMITIGTLVFTFAILGIVGFVIYKLIIVPNQVRKRLLQTGARAKAKILGISETGVTVNNRPQVRLALEITPEGSFQAPYQAETKMLISMVQIPQFQPGTRLIVRYNPQNIGEVAIEGLDLSAPAS